ncbi:MAG: PEP-CTERM sorting domain-containing protein [Actinobacteria bacterium]|nr:PEP-CTERM sorting domain-containing protein [Actinomycetota bacterium]
MKTQLKLLSKAAILALIGFGAVEQTSQAQISITMSVNGYFGNNLSASGANLADGTIVKLGMFYNNSAFTPTADVSASWVSLSGSMQSRLSTFDDNFYSFASTTMNSASGNGAEFQILYSPDPDVQHDVAFQKFFTLSPAVTSPGLSGINLVGYKPFVWIETVDRSEFGLYQARAAFPTGTFPDNDYSFDVIASNATALVGTLLVDDTGVQLSAVPEPSVTAMSLVGVAFVSLLRRRGSVVKS